MTRTAKAMLAIAVGPLPCLLAALSACDGGVARERLGAAGQAVSCRGVYVEGVVARVGEVVIVSPGHLATSAEGWGPQLLSVSVNRAFSTEVVVQGSDTGSEDQDSVTKSLEETASNGVTATTELIAGTTVAVPSGAYYRVEAYPQYQVLDFAVRRGSCGPFPDVWLAAGVAYQPVGMYFRGLVFADDAWSPLDPPSPSEVPDPALAAGDGGVDAMDAADGG